MAATPRTGLRGGKPVLLVLGAGLAAMLLASAAWRLTHPSLTIPNQRAGQDHGAAPQMPGGMPPGAAAGGPEGMPGGAPAGMAGMGEIGQLMTRAAANPRDVEALTGIAERLLMMNSPGKAMVFVDRALSEQPADVHLLDMKAVALAGLGRDAEAADYLGQALKLAPDDVNVRFHLGMLLKYSLGKPDQAAAHFKAVQGAKDADPELVRQAGEELRTPAPPAAPAAPAKP